MCGKLPAGESKVASPQPAGPGRVARWPRPRRGCPQGVCPRGHWRSGAATGRSAPGFLAGAALRVTGPGACPCAVVRMAVGPDATDVTHAGVVAAGVAAGRAVPGLLRILGIRPILAAVVRVCVGADATDVAHASVVAAWIAAGRAILGISAIIPLVRLAIILRSLVGHAAVVRVGAGTCTTFHASAIVVAAGPAAGRAVPAACTGIHFVFDVHGFFTFPCLSFPRKKYPGRFKGPAPWVDVWRHPLGVVAHARPPGTSRQPGGVAVRAPMAADGPSAWADWIRPHHRRPSRGDPGGHAFAPGLPAGPMRVRRFPGPPGPRPWSRRQRPWSG